MAKRPAASGKGRKVPPADERSDSVDTGKELLSAKEPSLSALNPPPIPGISPSTAVGIQFMMQRSSLEQLDPDIQSKLIELTDVMDQRGYEFATKDLDDRATARMQAVYSISGFALLVILGGGSLCFWLVTKGEFDKAFTLAMAGIGVIGALLGGAGLQSVFKQLSGR